MGLKLAGSVGSRLGFLMMGWTMACLKWDGTMPEVREEFMISSILGPRVSKASFRSREGRISEEQVVGFILETISERQERDSGLNWDRMAVGAGGGWWLTDDGEMLDRIMATLSMKNCRNCSHIVVDVSGLTAAIGLRMVLMVSKRILGL